MANKDIVNAMKNKTAEEKAEIYKRAGATRRKNNAKKHRLKNKMEALLTTQIKGNDGKYYTPEDEMLKNLVFEATTPGGKNVVAAVKEIRDIIGDKNPEDDKSPTVTVVFGENKGIDL